MVDKAQTNPTSDIIISGAGVPGLTLALLLAPLGLSVTLIDPNAPEPLDKLKPDNRTSALMQSSVNVLKAADADSWEKCQTYIAPLKTLRIIDETGGSRPEPLKFDFSAREIGLSHFADNVPNNVLRSALWEACTRHEKIHMICPAALARFDADDFKVTAHLEDGQTVTGRLLIGADGRRSVVRAQAGIGTDTKPIRQHAITCRIEHSVHHDFISTEFHRQTGPFTLVPLPGNVSSVVWVTPEDTANSFMSLDKGSFVKALQDRTRGVLGEITLLDSPASYPLQPLTADRITGKRVVLIAEAAHALHPMGAQGLNLSLRDAAVLAELIIDHSRLGIDIGSRPVLEAYAQKRRLDITSRMNGTYGLSRMLSHHLAPLHNIRRKGLKAITALPALKEYIMKEGMAPEFAGENRLLNGQPL